MSPEHYLPETVGPGCAFIDYDNDGWMDIYLVNSGACDFYTPRESLRNALYKNNRDGTFADVTDKAGVGAGTFGMGAAVGDYDNDGYPDLLVTAYGHSILYHNNGDGTFTDVTRKAGIVSPDWTTSAVWFDYDNDGRLDLFLCSFVEFRADTHINCGTNKAGKRYYCIPRVFKPTSSLLYRNNGDGTFTLVSKGTDIEAALGKALGAVATDINNDGLMDLFVANDTVQNFLFVNRGKGDWEEIGMFAEVAFSADGKARSGIEAAAARSFMRTKRAVAEGSRQALIASFEELQHVASVASAIPTALRSSSKGTPLPTRSAGSLSWAGNTARRNGGLGGLS